MWDTKTNETKQGRGLRANPRSLGAVERVRGIEPLSKAWEAAVLPLNYTRSTAAILAPGKTAAAR